VQARLEDVLENIDAAESFVAGHDTASLARDMKTLYAVERALEIVSEASRYLPSELKARHPQIPWQQIADMGNIYRHAYEKVNIRLVWETATLHLSLLRPVIIAELKTLSG
jgi:uncharacterized protein with HEPN domain